ncbi:hypothetical protein L484_026325 [Morus notabilis]|uniref:Uncharacterized protein n=1 Tax=Morus notabilis TaxID=981085 RepID=W9QY48_9ROSA|nr:hypothetical protein L484_026325 [Morus notabilis]
MDGQSREATFRQISAPPSEIYNIRLVAYDPRQTTRQRLTWSGFRAKAASGIWVSRNRGQLDLGLAQWRSATFSSYTTEVDGFWVAQWWLARSWVGHRMLARDSVACLMLVTEAVEKITLRSHVSINDDCDSSLVLPSTAKKHFAYLVSEKRKKRLCQDLPTARTNSSLQWVVIHKRKREKEKGERERES